MKENVLKSHNYADRLRELRIEKGLLQKDVAEYISVTRTAYNKYEVAENEPSISSLIKLAELYDVSIDYIIGKQDERGDSSAAREIDADNKKIEDTTVSDLDSDLLAMLKSCSDSEIQMIRGFLAGLRASNKS